jgi:hypothetical protein
VTQIHTHGNPQKMRGYSSVVEHAIAVYATIAGSVYVSLLSLWLTQCLIFPSVRTSVLPFLNLFGFWNVEGPVGDGARNVW